MIQDNLFPLMQLPEELIVNIFAQLPVSNLCKVEQCSSDCQRLVREAYKNQINEFLTSLKDFNLTHTWRIETQKFKKRIVSNNLDSLGNRVIKKWKEIGKRWAKDYEETGITSSQHIRQFYKLKTLFKDYLVNEVRLNLEKSDLSCLPTFLRNMLQSNKRAPLDFDVLPKLGYYHGLISQWSGSKRGIKPLASEKIGKQFAKIDIYLTIGRQEAEERLAKVNQEGVFVLRPSSRPGSLAVSYLQNGQVARCLVDTACYSYTSLFNMLKSKACFKKSLADAEKELGVSPEHQSKISPTEYQGLYQALAEEIKSLDCYIPQMTRQEAEVLLKSEYCCLRLSSTMDAYGNFHFVLSYKLTQGNAIHHLISIDDYGRLIINEIPYSSITEFLNKGIANKFFKKFYTLQNYQKDKRDLELGSSLNI
jgi:hypothetical protein